MDYNISAFKKALSFAEKSKGVGIGKFKLGAVIYNGSKFIAGGRNKNKTHPSAPGEGYLHAEFDGIVRAVRKVGARMDDRENPKPLKGCKIYVVRIGRDGKLRMAKPCNECMSIIKKVGIKEIYYTGMNGNFKKEIV